MPQRHPTMEVKRRRRRRAALIGLVPAAAAVAYGSARSALQIDAPALLSSYLSAVVGDGPAIAKAAYAFATLTRRTKNATECGWVDGEPVAVKPFGIVVYSGAKRNQRRRRRLQAIAGGVFGYSMGQDEFSFSYGLRMYTKHFCYNFLHE